MYLRTSTESPCRGSRERRVALRCRWRIRRPTHCKVRESTRYCQDKPANLALGVMRFLQTEWHRHERDRNAWEIERAEMKSRISLSKHIKMLELALRKEREKIKGLSNGEEVDMKDAKELAREQLKAAGKGMCFASGLTSVTDSCQGHSWTLSTANQMSIQSTHLHRA